MPIEAWYYNETKDDQRAPHRFSPNRYAAPNVDGQVIAWLPRETPMSRGKRTGCGG